MTTYLLGCFCMFLVTTSLLRALYLIFLLNGSLPNTRSSRRHAARTMIILGSGGHTTEILRIVAKMKSDRYSPRIYIRASTDKISEAKVKELEGQASDYQLLDIRRSREVHQPYLASLWTTTVAIVNSIPIVFHERPELILCNGPGTCIPICLVAFFYKVLFLSRVKVVFVESFCRVKTLSLSGKISYFIADFVLVRWQNFNNSLYHRTVYLTKYSMDVAQLTKDLLPKSLLSDIQRNSPPDIGVHLTRIFHKLSIYVNGTGNENTSGMHKWLQTATVTLEACLDRTWEVLNSGCWKDVSITHRYCYSFCTILKSALMLAQLRNVPPGENLPSMAKSVLIKVLLQIDKGILLGAPPLSVSGLLPTVARKLNAAILEASGSKCGVDTDPVQLSSHAVPKKLLRGYAPVARHLRPSMEAFHRDIFRTKTPTILEGCMDHWRALNLWQDSGYLLRTAGVRTVPIEIGSRYTEEDWTQRLVTFSEFLQSYVTSEDRSKRGYLAQHGLFDQIPELMDDISIPEYCTFSDTGNEATAPDVNAWLGPVGTISPLHFDPKNNILCQVFGTKQVVLFDPQQTPNLYPYETRFLSNTARVDPLNPDFETWPKFRKATGMTCTLGPGEMLFIPPGWWHHIVALSPSFSVSFWWD